MKLSQHVVASGILLLMSACASQSIEDHYYSLVLAGDTPAATVAKSDKKLIVGPIQLPAYLNQRSLTMQLGSTRIRAANHHFWAEPLDEAISKVLASDLSRRVDGTIIDRDAGRWTNSNDCRLRVEFDKFHATDNASVVSSGRYWIGNLGADVKREFEMSQSLSSDGYGHAVDSLRILLRQLGDHVSQTIMEQPNCVR